VKQFFVEMRVMAKCIPAALLLLFGSSIAPLSAKEPAPALELLVLGSGGPGAAGRAASSYLVFVDGKARILVDAGPGSFARLGEAHTSLSNTDLVLLTHLHIDHVGELPGLFKARVVATSGPIVFNVWGPGGAPEHGADAYFPGTREFVQMLFGRKGAFAYLQDFSAPMTIHAHDVASAETLAPRELVQEGDLKVTAILGHHGDAPAVIYRIDHTGKSITFSGDIDAHGLPALRTIAAGTDLLVFNCVVLDPPGSPAILYTLHTPPQAIGLLAKEVGTRALLLSHISPAVDEMESAVTASIRRNYPASTAFAKDGMRVRP
jgi:ribonuclease BN (tRNA processing enzyme)